MKLRHRVLFLGGGVGLVASFAIIATSGELHLHIPFFLGLYAMAFGFYAAGAFAVSRLGSDSKRVLLFVIFVAVVGRLVLVSTEPSVSMDTYRYLWEGRVTVAGQNPFELAPDAPELVQMRDDDYESIGHKHLATIYPPFAQSIFALAVKIHPSITTLKLLFMCFDLAVIFVLVGLLRAFGKPGTRVLLYAWNPLVIFETAHSGHVDVVGLLFLMLGLYFLVRGRARWGIVALAVSFLSKLTSAILVPFIVLRRRLSPLLIAAVLIVVAGYLPYAGAGWGLFKSLGVYGAQWNFNGFAYLFLASISSPAVARGILAVVAIVLVFYFAKRETDPLRYAFLAFGTVLLLSPTLYPWYLIWIVPFACLFQSRPWLLLTATIFASYWVWVVFGETGNWRLPAVVFLIEFLPFFALFAFDRTRFRGALST